MKEEHIICNICGEDLGIERMYWAVEHLEKYPDHLSYRNEIREVDITS